MSSEKTYLMIGNTRWHWANKSEDGWKYFHTAPNPINFQKKDYSQVFWASVGPIPKELKLFPANEINLNNIPLINLPSNLGIDRALAAWSAFQKFSSLKKNKKGLIIVDAGTILSITRINERGEFTGGQLIPGFNLQLSSMAKGALKLEKPEIKMIPKDKFQKETHKAMIKGVISSLSGAILLASEESRLPIWLCGGNASILLNELKNKSIDIKLYPNLVLEGMINIHQKLNSI